MTNFADMIDGYHRFRNTGWAEQRDRWDELRDGQSPKVMVIACSDSRVDPAQIFDTNPGEVFVVRNVAALVPPFETTPGLHGVSAALEFAVQVLKVGEIVVMGHGRCGGCQAALTQELKDAPPQPRRGTGHGTGRRQGQPCQSEDLPLHPGKGTGRNHSAGWRLFRHLRRDLAHPGRGARRVRAGIKP